MPDPARDGQPGLAEPQHKNGLTGEVHRQRIFKVLKPTGTGMIVTIQKRTGSGFCFRPADARIGLNLLRKLASNEIKLWFAVLISANLQRA
jgi:hypothetical protein